MGELHHLRPPTLTTAARFADEINARRVLRERMPTRFEADVLARTIELDLDAIMRRHMIGASGTRDADGNLALITFIDESTAIRDELGRWWPTS